MTKPPTADETVDSAMAEPDRSSVAAADEALSGIPYEGCPLVVAFLRLWRGSMPAEAWDPLLRPLVPLAPPVLDAATVTRPLERRRSMLATDWLVRTFGPAWLRRAGLKAQADAMAGLPEATKKTHLPLLERAVEAVAEDVRSIEGAHRASPVWGGRFSAGQDRFSIAMDREKLRAVQSSFLYPLFLYFAEAAALAADAAGELFQGRKYSLSYNVRSSALLAASMVAAGAAGSLDGGAAMDAARAAVDEAFEAEFHRHWNAAWGRNFPARRQPAPDDDDVGTWYFRFSVVEMAVDSATKATEPIAMGVIRNTFGDTRAELQQSALDLVRRMAAVGKGT